MRSCELKGRFRTIHASRMVSTRLVQFNPQQGYHHAAVRTHAILLFHYGSAQSCAATMYFISALDVAKKDDDGYRVCVSTWQAEKVAARGRCLPPSTDHSQQSFLAERPEPGTQYGGTATSHVLLFVHVSPKESIYESITIPWSHRTTSPSSWLWWYGDTVHVRYKVRWEWSRGAWFYF